MGIIKRNIDQLDKLLHQPSMDRYFVKFEEKTNIQRKWIGVAVITCAAMGLIIGYASQLICNVLGFMYPAFESIKAIESADSKDDTKWLTYWVVYSTFIILEFFSDYLLFWIPFYYLIKCALLIWCMHPSYNGTAFIYSNIIRPLFLQNEKKIDDLLSKGQKEADKLIDQAKDEVNDLRDELAESDAAKQAATSVLTAAAQSAVGSSKQD